MPQTLFSLRCMRTRRNEPGVGRHRVGDAVEDAEQQRALAAGLREVEAAGHRIGVVAEVDVDHRVGRVHVHHDLDRDAVLGVGEGVVHRRGLGPAARHLAHGGDHELLAVVEPLLGKLREGVPADLAAEGRNLALTDPRRAERRQVVAPPLVGDADAQAAHADDVLDVLVVALDLNCREDQRAFLVNVPRAAVIGGGDGVAAVRLMGLGHHGEAVHAFVVHHRHERRVIGGVGAAVIGRVVEVGVALLEVRVKRLHRLAHHVGAAQDVNRQALVDCEQPVLGRYDAAGEVARAVEHAGAPGAQQRVRHLRADGLHPLVDDRHLYAVERTVGVEGQCVPCHRSAPSLRALSGDCPRAGARPWPRGRSQRW